MTLLREEAVAKTSSPEQLDQPVRVVPPLGWLAVLATAFLTVCVVIWSFVGRVPVTVEGSGILIPPVGLKNIVSLIDGQVSEVHTKVDEEISAGTVVARIQPSSGYPEVANVDVVSPFGGRIGRVLVEPGEFIRTGQALFDLSGNERKPSFILYLPTDQGSKVRPGMAVRVEPSNVDKSLHGYLLGSVDEVSKYPVTSEEMMETLGSEELVKLFLKGSDPEQSAPIAVKVSLWQDPNSATGYHWSSKSPPPYPPQAGTVGRATIVTEERAPVTFVIPFFRKELDADD